MADRKITDLTALAAGSQATGDLLTIVDVSEGAAADKNKKMTMENLFKGIPGDVGIGTSVPAKNLEINRSSPSLRFTDTSNSSYSQIDVYNSDLYIAADLNATDNGQIIFRTNGENERVRIDSSGRLLVGATASTHSDAQARLQVHSAGATNIVIARNDSTISAGNTIGMLQFYGNDGGTYQQCAAIRCDADLDHANNDKPSRLVFETTADDASSGTERMRIDSGGRVAIGTTQIGSGVLTVYGASTARAMFQGTSTGTGDSQGFTTGNNGGVNAFLWNYENGNIRLATNNTERMRIDSSGNVGIGVTSPGQLLHLEASNAGGNIRVQSRAFFGSQYSNHFAVIGSAVRADTGQTAGMVSTETSSGNGRPSAIRFGAGAIQFHSATSSTAGAAFDSERMRINSNGDLLIGQSSTDTPGYGNTTLGASFEALGADGTALFVSRSGNIAAGFNRAQDGNIVDFSSAGSIEGSINISGTTTSYNGAHLSRWSQLAGGAERTEILRGSVLSNIDEMCEWGEEDNEQLNRMKVSDVEGDVNVSGVFQAWDDDDDTYTNDFYCAMTGDFIIRIAQGTTVARGDLLMSAGDGTAKPQDDDIVRSKTIAKVTSTTVSTTYADGSYCVPCVLMAC